MDSMQRVAKLEMNGKKVLYHVLRDRSFEIQDAVQRKSSSGKSRQGDKKRDFVSVIPILEGQTGGPRIVMILVPRPAIGVWSIELPGGRIKEGETHVAAAHRKALEEGGLEVGRMAPMANIARDSLTLSERDHVFVGEELVVIGRKRTVDKKQLMVFSASISHVNHYLQHNNIVNAVTATALSAYLRATGQDAHTEIDYSGRNAITAQDLTLRL